MSQVKYNIAPVSAGCHPQKSTAGREQVRLPRPRPVDGNPTGSAPRIESAPSTSVMARRGPSSATLIGEAGSNLVLSRLQSWGFAAYPAMAGLAYDLIVEIPRLDRLRIQVKTRSQPLGRRCSFKMQRGYHRSRVGIFDYADNDFELSAFVCLSMSRVFFYPGVRRRISVQTSWLRLPGIDRETFDLALKLIRHRRNAEALASLPTLAADPPATRPQHGEDPQTEFDFGPRS